MTSAQRVLTALSHQEPDRVPLALDLSLRGARELGLGIREYFDDPRAVVEAQLRMQRRFRSDVLFGFLHGALEHEAWGGELVWFDDGPPNSAEPVLGPGQPIEALQVPELRTTPGLQRALRAIEGLKAGVGDEVPIFGVALSPFSLPVLQLGFERYLDLLLGDRAAFWRLMDRNIAFTQTWANAQLAAGAAGIIYFDPLASPTLVPVALYRETGAAVAHTALAGILGPCATHLASGRTLGALEDLIGTGTVAVGASWNEDLAAVKAVCKGRITVVGNLNGLEMAAWSQADTERIVREAIAKAGAGGGFILSDNHGEIPWDVPDDTLLALAEAVMAHGRYPLKDALIHA